MLVVSSKSNLGCEAGCGLRFHARIILGSCSDHSRIMVGSAPHWKWRFTCFWRFSLTSCSVIFRGRCSIWGGWIVTPVAPRIGNDVSYVRTIQQSSHFSWQVQYLVKFKCHFSWQAQYLVKFKCHFSWQAQYLVTFKWHFWWQAQYLVKVWM